MCADFRSVDAVVFASREMLSTMFKPSRAETWRIVAGCGLLSFALGMTCILVPHVVRAGTEADAASAARHAYSQQVAEKYDYRFGKDHPFLPSNMQTDTGEFIDPKQFPTAQYCGRCHQEAHAQWRQSAHSNSNRAPWYLKNVNLLNAQTA